MPRTEEKIYGCFRCGAIKPPLRHDLTTDKVYCGECGERGVVTFQQALDMLNDIYRRDPKDVIEALELDEFYIEEEE